MKTPTRRDMLQLLAASMVMPLASGAEAGNAKKDRIKIGQIGVGHAHATKLKAYRASPDYDVVGIVEPDEVLRKEASAKEEFKGIPWMSQEQLLNTPGLQAILVETRIDDLLDTAEKCIAAGKHIHLDKPAGTSLPQFQRILDAATTQKLLVQMGYMYRYNPGIVLLREVLKQGWLGDPFEVHAVMSKVVPDDRRGAMAKYQGGMMFELGCHLIDLVVGVLGKPKKVTPYSQHAGKFSDALQDNMLAVFEYPHALASVKSTALEVDGQQRRHFVLCGSEGTFHIQPLDKPAVRVTFSKPHSKYRQGYQDIALPKYLRYEADAADMAKILRGEKESDYPYAHDLAVQTALLEASKMPGP